MSPYAKEELKAYKTLEGFKYLIDGWVSTIIFFKQFFLGAEVALLTARACVRHSQEPLKSQF